MTRSRFEGEIFGIGSESGIRIVVGHWTRSPLGTFTDVMIEFADGHRLLVAPSHAVREFVMATYSFDDTAITPVTCERRGAMALVSAGELVVRIEVGGPTVLGRVLGVVPAAIATAPWFCAFTDPIARVVLRGVRTRGTAGNDRREYYGARMQPRIIAIEGTWDGTDLGQLQPVDPPVRFGFGSTPRSPSCTTITTTIDTA
ncbi:hypothetical protein [Antrihabitans sp. YC2-6]|uniref:hypothetical protein n=1 Tax=Antrihabitans sp. YC2-6 TaxID=2799498 RepID=UPI0018F66C5F|nr:hypothetical protein [Antrihabitans sp. YC2-6]MBJ8345144.1 hypothetical protein [Antrihabitans sp. YC2-6]